MIAETIHSAMVHESVAAYIHRFFEYHNFLAY